MMGRRGATLDVAWAFSDTITIGAATGECAAVAVVLHDALVAAVIIAEALANGCEDGLGVDAASTTEPAAGVTAAAVAAPLHVATGCVDAAREVVPSDVGRHGVVVLTGAAIAAG